MAQRIRATTFRPLNVHVARGSRAEKVYYANAAIPEELTPGIPPSPDHNLINHGGKTIPNLTFTNFYVGGANSWRPADISAIDRALSAAMSDQQLNNVMVQYFGSGPITTSFTPSTTLDGGPPAVMGKSDVEQLVTQLSQQGTLNGFDLSATVFCLMLPSGTILNDDVPAGSVAQSSRRRRVRAQERVPDLPGPDDKANSLQGLGGYHGSVHVPQADGTQATVYYAVGVFSEIRPDGTQNGIVAFDQPWKNVVATFYHELNEARTDADVEDAINAGSDPAAVGFLGWMSAQGEECGDFPVFEANPLSQVFQEVELSDHSGTVPVQFMYSNAVQGPEGPVNHPESIAPPLSGQGPSMQPPPSS